MELPARRENEKMFEYSLSEIIDVDDLQRLQDSFAKANRVASTIVDVHGLPITMPSNHSPVCKLIRSSAKGEKNCIRSGKILGDISHQTQKPSFHFCKSVGFVDAAAPIVIEGVHIANWLIGQSWIGEVNEERITSYAEEIGVDGKELLLAFQSMDVIPEDEFKEKLDFLWLMANQISNQAYQQLRYQKMMKSLEKSKNELSVYKDNLEIIVSQRTAELETAFEKIKEISEKDALTGCFNRGALNSSLPKEMKRAERYNNPISILLCDLDHFKNINDTYGHQSGDLVLQEVVSTIQKNIRTDIDWLARYGGEEFLLVMPLTPEKGALVIAERLRKIIEEIPFTLVGELVKITASFGLTSIEDWQQQEKISHGDFLHSADVNLYKAKEGGRNRVVGGLLGFLNDKDEEDKQS